MKVVLLGQTGVGKSSIVLRFVTNQFDKNSDATIGASFLSKTISVDTSTIKFQIWDTAGQEKYRSLAPMYYRGAAAAIIVYDITRVSTFDTLQSWVKELHNLGPENIVIVLVGNKCDLESEREVDFARAQHYAESIGAICIETSAKTNVHVHDAFVEIVRRLPEGEEEGDAVDPHVDLSRKKKEGGGCAC